MQKFFLKDKKFNPKVYMEAQRTMNSQGNIEQKKATQYLTPNYTTES
jgi:hypothetical protein